MPAKAAASASTKSAAAANNLINLVAQQAANKNKKRAPLTAGQRSARSRANATIKVEKTKAGLRATERADRAAKATAERAQRAGIRSTEQKARATATATERQARAATRASEQTAKASAAARDRAEKIANRRAYGQEIRQRQTEARAASQALYDQRQAAKQTAKRSDLAAKQSAARRGAAIGLAKSGASGAFNTARPSNVVANPVLLIIFTLFGLLIFYQIVTAADAFSGFLGSVQTGLRKLSTTSPLFETVSK